MAFAVPDTGIFADLDPKVRLRLFPPPSNAAVSIDVNKKKRTLTVLYNGSPIKTYPIALGFAPVGDKQKQGDGKTPEGNYFISVMESEHLAPKYGARSLLISYPSTKDADRGVQQKLITPVQRDLIAAQIASFETPSQNTPLGSSIRIHGGGIGTDWTHGCIALRDEDVKELYSVVRKGTQVHISASGPGKKSDKDNDGIWDLVDIAVGALKADLNDAAYDGSFETIAYPKGDVARTKGVCTDVVIRAFRNAGIDLQQEIHQDILARPQAYRHIAQPSTHIDHRRVKNMVIYMSRHLSSLPIDGDFLPGDVVLFDTLPKAGADHIGIVSDEIGPSGAPLIVNNWTYGAVTDKMDLLPYVPVTHHFRVK